MTCSICRHTVNILDYLQTFSRHSRHALDGLDVYKIPQNKDILNQMQKMQMSGRFQTQFRLSRPPLDVLQSLQTISRHSTHPLDVLDVLSQNIGHPIVLYNIVSQSERGVALVTLLPPKVNHRKRKWRKNCERTFPLSTAIPFILSELRLRAKKHLDKIAYIIYQV